MNRKQVSKKNVTQKIPLLPKAFRRAPDAFGFPPLPKRIDRFPIKKPISSGYYPLSGATLKNFP